MGDYVDRKRLKEAIQEDAINCLSCYNGEVLDLVLMDIDEVPAADVRPVVRGRWEHGAGRIIATCTVCGFTRNLNENFGAAIACPNCGADMRGE